MIQKKTADLKPAEYNPRKKLKPGMPEYEKLKRSIEQFGYVDPVYCDVIVKRWEQFTGQQATLCT